MASPAYAFDGRSGDKVIIKSGEVVNYDLYITAQEFILDGSVLLVGEKTSIGGDIIGAGYSLEVQEGSKVGQDIVFAGGQILLAGDVSR